MGTINVGGNYFQFVGADASNNVIKASDGKYYQKGENGKYRILENGESIFNAIQQEATQDYNKSNGFVQNKKYYVEGNSSYYTMVDKNYNTVYYKDNQQITKEQFLKDANCVYNAKSKKYVAKNLNENSHKYAQKYRRTVPDSKSGRYYVVVKGGKKLYFEKNGQQISERAFLDTEEACLDKNGNVVKYDWKMKVSKAFDGVCDMAKDMVSEAKPIPKRNENGSIMIDENGQIVYEKNKDGSVKTKREFSLGRTCTTIVVGVGIVVAAPVVASAATVLGASAAISAGLATATNVAISATFVGLGAKQMADANERNKDVTLSNNERLENWEQKGQGAAQVGMGLLMGGKSIKDAPKAYAKAKATANAIEVRNNATMASKGKISVTEKFANRCKGLKDATSASMSLTKTAQDTYRSTKNYVKKNSAKQIAKDIVKAPLKGVKNAVTDTYNTVRHPIRTAKNWAEGFKAGKSEASGALTPEQQIIKTDAQVKFNEVLPKENQARIAKYESLIENTTDKAQNAGLLETIKADNTLSPNEKSGILRKFFEKNQDQYPEVVSQIKTNDAETALKEAKSTQDLAKIDKEALTEKSQKRYEEQQSYFKEQEAKSFAKFGRMIEKSDDMSQVRAELSNNPEFDRLSPAQKNEIIGKINQREATLDSGTTPAKKPSYTQRAKNWVNKTVDNIKTKWNNRATAKTIAKFEKMIKKSDDYANTRTKMEGDSNFQKLSDAQKQALRDKLEAYENMQKLHEARINAEKVNTESELHETTKNTNNPNEIATKNSVGKLGENKFAKMKEEFSQEVDAITSLDDPNIAVLRKRAESLSTREQSRALENILNDKIKELKPEEVVETPKAKQITNHDKNKIVKNINKAESMADLDAQINALQENGFFDNANPKQVKSVNNAISAKRAELGKKQAKANNSTQKMPADKSATSTTKTSELQVSKKEITKRNSSEVNKLSNFKEITPSAKEAKMNFEFNSDGNLGSITRGNVKITIKYLENGKVELQKFVNGKLKNSGTATIEELNTVLKQCGYNGPMPKGMKPNTEVVKTNPQEAMAKLDAPKKSNTTVQEKIANDTKKTDTKGNSNILRNLGAMMLAGTLGNHKVNTDTDDYMINHPKELYQEAVPENKVKPAVVAQETEDLDETEDIDTNEDTEVEDDVTTPEETEAPEEAGTEPEAPQATPEETNTTEEPEAESETPKTTTEKTAQNDTTSPDENNTKANDASAPSESSRVTTDKTSPDKETVKSNSELETTDTEPDIPAEQKRDITKRVLQANSDDEIADALTELREVGRFKGRKNLRRLLKAKRRNNQKRADKYKQRVLDNQEQINEAYKEKYKKKFEA